MNAALTDSAFTNAAFRCSTHADRTRRILVEDAVDESSPRRHTDPLTTFVGLPNRHYRFGDETQSPSDEQTPIEILAQRMDAARAAGGSAWAVWCYDHDGVAFRLTTGFAVRPHPFDPFDTYPAGALLVSDERAATADPDRLARCVRAELQDYQAWVNGDVYQVVRETADVCRHCGHREWSQDDAVLVYGAEQIAAAVRDLGGFDPGATDTGGWTCADGEAG